MRELINYIIDKIDYKTEIVLKEPENCDNEQVLRTAGMIEAYEDILRKIKEIEEKEL